MKTAAEIYKEDDACSWYDYDPMLAAFGEIVLQVDDSDYQGDSRVLYVDGDRVGFLQFGWGSCSGCDALQACSSIDEVQTLMDELRGQIRWFENKDAALAWFSTHDWEGDYSWHEQEQKTFVRQVKAFLAGGTTDIEMTGGSSED